MRHMWCVAPTASCASTQCCLTSKTASSPMQH
jgi:hypothetical protein